MKRIHSVLVPLALLAFSSAAGAQVVTAGNVGVVEYRSPDGRTVGSFRDLGKGHWVEKNAKGETAFAEDRRDGRTVYLATATRGIQLDLATKTILYTDRQTPKATLLYNITGTQANAHPTTTGRQLPVLPALAPLSPDVNGLNVKDVRYRSPDGNSVGGFIETSKGRWVEAGNDKIHNAPGETERGFAETKRTLHTVEMTSSLRGETVVLDLGTRKVSLTYRNVTSQPYDITTVSSGKGK